MPGSYELLELLTAAPIHVLLIAAVLAFTAFRTRTRLRKWRGAFLLLFLWAWITSTPLFAHALVNWLEEAASAESLPPTTPDAPLIVVLAAGEPWFRGNRDPLQLDLASQRRTICAADVWRELGGRVLFLGSIRGEGDRAVSVRMAELATRLGVPADALDAIPGSHNTFENLQDVPATRRPLVLVTSAMHMRRALAVARQRELAMHPVACDFRGRRGLGLRAYFPDNGALPLYTSALHEIVGYLYYEWRGWL